MTRTDELIRRLAADVTPLSSGAASRRLAAGIALGAAASFVAILAWLGPPLQALPHIGAAAIAVKLSYSLALLLVCFVLLLGAGRPGHELRGRWLWLLVPPALVAWSAAMEVSMTAPQSLLGSMWLMCLLKIVILSVPVFAGVLWAFRHLAPTRLRLAGLLAGMTAGSAAATIYALYCPETTATFLVSSLGILAAGLIGALTGPRLLRW